MATLVNKTTKLPPAYIGVPYDAAVAVTAQTVSTALVISNATNTSGLPAGLAYSATEARITGTPTGAASTPAGSGVAQSGPGTYPTVFNYANGTDTLTNVSLPIVLDYQPQDPEGVSNSGGYSAAAELNRKWPLGNQ